MEDDYIFNENEYVIDSGSPEESLDSSEVPENDNNISDEQIIDAIREVINENIEEGNNLLLDTDISENVVQDTPIEEQEIIDYTDLLIDIKYELIELNSNIVSLSDDYNSTILDKSLNDYNISDSLLVLIVIMFFVKGFVYFIKHFTPKLWR